MQGHRSMRKQTFLGQLSLKVFNWCFGLNVGLCWDLSVWWISYSFYHVHSILKGENPTDLISLKRTFNAGSYSDIYTPLSVQLVIIGTTKLYILISFGWPRSSFKVTAVWEIKNFGVYFFRKFPQSVWMKCSMLPHPVGLLKLMLNLVCTCKGMNSADGTNIFLCWGTCESICFKLGTMLDTTKLNTLIPIWMTLLFTQGHRVMAKPEFVQLLIGLLDSFGFVQSVRVPTHRRGHTIGWIVHRADQSVVKAVVINQTLPFDNFCPLFHLHLFRPPPWKVYVQARNFTAVDVTVFNSDLMAGLAV